MTPEKKQWWKDIPVIASVIGGLMMLGSCAVTVVNFLQLPKALEANTVLIEANKVAMEDLIAKNKASADANKTNSDDQIRELRKKFYRVNRYLSKRDPNFEKTMREMKEASE